MRFDILTIFPKIFDSYFNESILKRAQEKRLIKVAAHNLRDFTTDKHHKVDDSPYGGGPGMVIKIEPVYRAVQFAKGKAERANGKTKVILFSTRGKKLTSKIAKQLAKCHQLILICGRYEGVDERVAKYIADEEISIGDYVLSGGELPAMVLVESVSRYIPGVLGKYESLEEVKGSYPVYTRPEVFVSQKVRNVRNDRSDRINQAKPSQTWRSRSIKRSDRTVRTKRAWRVPKVLLSGSHKKIEKWRKIRL